MSLEKGVIVNYNLPMGVKVLATALASLFRAL